MTWQLHYAAICDFVTFEICPVAMYISVYVYGNIYSVKRHKYISFQWSHTSEGLTVLYISYSIAQLPSKVLKPTILSNYHNAKNNYYNQNMKPFKRAISF